MAEQLPSALRFYARAIMNRIMGADDTVFTEKDFNSDELAVLREMEKLVVEGDAAGTRSPFFKNTIRYSDWNKLLKQKPDILSEGSTLKTVDLLFQDTARSLAYTLGQAKLKDGRITDRYDFMYRPYNTSLRSIFESMVSDSDTAAGGALSVPEKIISKFSLGPGEGFPVNINLRQNDGNN